MNRALIATFHALLRDFLRDLRDLRVSILPSRLQTPGLGARG